MKNTFPKKGSIYPADMSKKTDGWEEWKWLAGNS